MWHVRLTGFFSKEKCKKKKKKNFKHQIKSTFICIALYTRKHVTEGFNTGVIPVCCTFVVHVGGHLDHTETEVDRQVVEVVVGLEEELSTQLHAVPFVVHLVDQHRVEVLVLVGNNKVTIWSKVSRCLP